MKSPLVLVTGVSGFIGSHLTRQLLQEGRWRVRGTLRNTITHTREKIIRQALLPGHVHRQMLEFVEVDLNMKEGWKEAVEGCRYVFHIASPTNFAGTSNGTSNNGVTDGEIIATAVNGTVNVLNACLESDTVKRVILTGSSASIAYSDDSYCHNEDDWTIPDSNTPPYVRGKIEAEKIAWKIVSHFNSSKTELVVVNPGLVVGPCVLPIHNTGSFQIMKSILDTDMPFVPDIPFSLIHVHDVVSAHIAAARIQEACGHRHIVTSEFLSLVDIANIIQKEFKPQSRPPERLPNLVIKLLKLIGNSDAKYLYSIVGKKITFDNRRMRKVLNVMPTRDVTKGIIESCYSLLETNTVPQVIPIV